MSSSFQRPPGEARALTWGQTGFVGIGYAAQALNKGGCSVRRGAVLKFIITFEQGADLALVPLTYVVSPAQESFPENIISLFAVLLLIQK